ncbi:hypothetical protein FS749_009520 [Ceratobasidium sp. UAMH 11750]|nr:hypothetical protein FS749_009520 [Ceratobasidium sp. UAMH 11750]
MRVAAMPESMIQTMGWVSVMYEMGGFGFRDEYGSMNSASESTIWGRTDYGQQEARGVAARYGDDK